MKDLKYQIKQTANTLSVRAVFYCFFAVIFIHLISVINRFWGSDIAGIYEAMKLRLMVDESNPITFRLIQLFPFIVVIPAGFSYMNDKNNDTDIFIRGRMGNRSYIRNKLTSSFIVSFMTYWIPFMIEIGILLIAIGPMANGDPSGISDYTESMQYSIDHYLFKDIYESHPIMYAILEVTMWATTVGALGCFSVCASLFGLKVKALVFLPVYILIYVAGFIGEALKLPYTTNYMWYMNSYDDHSKNDFIIWIFDALVLVVCVVIGMIMERRDRL